MLDIAPFADRSVLDIGCGTGFHLPWFAATAASVIGVEPNHELRALASRRTRRLDNVAVRPGLADALPVDAAGIDVAHARWAYFFGPGCEPGLAELDRVMRPGGAAFVIDNDPTRSVFGEWFGRGFPEVDPVAVERFWALQGWARERLLLAWTFDCRTDLEAVVRIELPTPVAAEVLDEWHDGLVVPYAVNLWWRRW